MEYLIALIVCIITIIILFLVFEINFKKIKKIGENKKLDKIVERFPENKEICKSILKKINNEKVKIKENEDKNNKTSLYVAITDTIFIANIKESFTRIQTIAHECLHSIQNRKLLIFNFIFSNIYLIYFALSTILTIIGVFKSYYIHIIILLLMSIIYYVVRSYLEMDAMIKAEYLAKEYINEYIKENPICKKEEVEELFSEYKKLNKIGIPATNFILIFNCIIKIIFYIVIIMLKIKFN